jgi:predicted nucleic acid-binding protein
MIVVSCHRTSEFLSGLSVASDFYVTADVLSEASKPKPDMEVLRFLGSKTIRLTFPTCVDFHRGIRWIEDYNPDKARRLRQWLNRMISLHGYSDRMNAQVAEAFADILACKALKDIWMPSPQAKYPGFGESVLVAAMALVHQVPIATMNRNVFSRINKYFSLPGIYYPNTMEWSGSAMSKGFTSDVGGRASEVRPAANLH